ncbi:MAG: DUF1684 domain-containing protein [Bacteroidetes bacterium]|nr:DUF1684 domain-containing protein [Bacteroidota bacterium]
MKKLLIPLLVLSCSTAFSQVDTRYYRLESDSIRLATDHEFRNKDHSPLSPSDRKHFEGLRYFAYDTDYLVVAKFERTPDGRPFQMQTTTERLPRYVKYGVLHFTLEGKELRLSVYQNLDLIQRAGYENYLFIPFNDSTNGFESYGGGRYLDIQGPLGDTVIIDFNRAYNPYCAYNSRYSCPIPPQENNLPLRIEAGVLSWKEH